MEDTLIIFIKNPVKGRVKTRLAKDVGDDEALEVYQYLLKKIRTLACSSNARLKLFYSDEIFLDDEWNPQYFDKYIQSGTDLGQRMLNAFLHINKNNLQKKIIIGSDCPDLSIENLDRAFEILDEYDIVIGPSQDGGYYLLGLKSVYPFLFEDISWSTPEVLQQTILKIKDAHLSYKLLPELNDIDTLSDWNQYKKSLIAGY